MTRLLPLFTLPLLLAACATTAPVNDAGTLYHYQLKATQGNDLTLEQALARVADADIVLVGELHTHPAVHLLQARMLAGLAADGRPLVLSMEQFSRADQPVLDAYLAGRIGEAALIRDGNAWPNYQSDYRPLVEFAKAHHLPVIAANAPKPLVSCVGQEGPAWLEQLPQPPLVLEIGAGRAIATVRHFSERLQRQGSPLLRINPQEVNVHNPKAVEIALGALEALQSIAQQLEPS